MKLKIITLLSLSAILLVSIFYHRNALWLAYNDFGQTIKNFQKFDFGNTLQSVANQITAPGPLNIGGKQNSVVLVKSKIIAQTNMQRFNNGTLPPLVVNAKLEAAALAKANDMFKNQYFEHVSPSDIDPGTLVKSYGYDYIVSGENLILGNFADEAELVQAWMDSPGHRANILHARFTEIGVAVIKGNYKGETVWISVQEFGLPLSACLSPSATLAAEIEANKAVLEQLSVQIEAKKQEIDNTDRRSEKYNTLVDEHNELANRYNQLAEKTKAIVLEYNAQITSFNNCVQGN